MAGSLLVATPILSDPNFHKTVVLLLQHDDENGAVGVILNRPTEEPVRDHIPAWGDAVAEPGLVHFGGPVEPAMAIGLCLGQGGEATAIPGLTMIDLSAEPTGAEGPLKVYSGYSGWGSGQLEAEIAEGAWYRVPAWPEDPFDSVEALWQKILRRQTGPLSIVSTYTERPDLN